MLEPVIFLPPIPEEIIQIHCCAGCQVTVKKGSGH